MIIFNHLHWIIEILILLTDFKLNRLNLTYRFDEFGGTDDFSTDDVAFVLSNHGAIKYEGDRLTNFLRKYFKLIF